MRFKRRRIGQLLSVMLMLSMIIGSTTVIATTVDERAASNKYIITCVKDNLDNKDMYIFANRLNSLGYSKEAENTNVTTSSLKNYFQNMYVKTVYHTGHGNVGSIMTANGSLRRGDVTVQAENIIIATCLTLSDTKWKNQFGGTAEKILGYTKVSYDYIDEDVVNNLGDALANGNNYMKGWYLANSPIYYLNDRWCGYVREGSNIVEYSARTGNIPKASTLHTGMVEKNVNASTALLADERTFEDQFKNYRDSDMTRLIPKEKAPAKFMSTSEEFLEKVTTSRNQAVELAQAWLVDNGYTTEDITLDYVSAIDAVVNDNDAMTVGYIVRYARTIDGLNIRSNGACDHISILVNGDEIVSVSDMWSDIQLTANQSGHELNIMPVNKALKNASKEISNQVKGGKVNFVTVNPCYSFQNEKIVPAYEFVSEDGITAIVSAENGEFISTK